MDRLERPPCSAVKSYVHESHQSENHSRPKYAEHDDGQHFRAERIHVGTRLKIN